MKVKNTMAINYNSNKMKSNETYSFNKQSNLLLKIWNIIQKHYVLFLVAALALRLVLSFLTWHPDVNNHVDWGTRFWQYGFKYFYDPDSSVWSYTWPNQPPGTIYIYAGLKLVSDYIFSLFWWLNLNVPVFPSNLMYYLEGHLFPAVLKLPSIIADFGIAVLIFRNLKDKKHAIIGSLLWLFNPVVCYNSSLWGQTDSIIAFFVFLSFHLLIKNKILLSVFAYAISIYIKASLLIFIPIYLIIFIQKKYSLIRLLVSSALSFFVIILLTMPFAQGNPVIWLYYLYQGKVFVQQLQVITANAFNIWATIASIHERPHTLLLGPLSYQIWGIVLFIISYIVLLWNYLRMKHENIFWLLSMVAFSSFMLLTNMHERYLYPLFPFFTIICVRNRKLMLMYFSVTIISLLNLYNFWWFPKINFIVDFLSFGNRLMPRILGLIMFIIYLQLFQFFLRQRDSLKL